MKILVVDDSVMARRLTIHELNNLGYSDIIEAVDGVDGLRKVEENEDIRVILLDQEMPNMSGLEFLRELRHNKNRPDIPVALITSVDGQDFKLEAAMNPDLDFFINKPVSNQSLIRFFTNLKLD